MKNFTSERPAAKIKLLNNIQIKKRCDMHLFFFLSCTNPQLETVWLAGRAAGRVSPILLPIYTHVEERWLVVELIDESGEFSTILIVKGNCVEFFDYVSKTAVSDKIAVS